MFSGMTGFFYCVKTKIPLSIFWQWLRAKWKADLITLAWCIPMLPLLAVWLVGAAFMMIGGALLATKNLLPSWAILPANLRDDQMKIIARARVYQNDMARVCKEFFPFSPKCVECGQPGKDDHKCEQFFMTATPTCVVCGKEKPATV